MKAVSQPLKNLRNWGWLKIKINVKVELRGPLSRYILDVNPVEPVWLKLSENATVLNILNILCINKESVSLVAVNGKKADPLTKLEEGDSVILFPPVAGG